MSPQLADQITKFAELINRISTFNEQNSGLSRIISLAVKKVVKSMGQKSPPQEPAQPKKTPSHEAAEIFKSYAGTLRAVGLEIVENNAAAVAKRLKADLRIKHEAEEIKSIKGDKLDLQIIDGDQLIKFLRSVSPMAAEKPEVKKSLNFLATTLNDDLIVKYVSSFIYGESKEWKPFLDTLEEVVSQLNRIGCKSEADIIAHNLEHAWKGDLREYLVANNLNLIKECGFGPHNWHTDCTAEYYAEYWSNALDVLDGIRANPKAKGLASTIIDYLSRSIDRAREEIRLASESNERLRTQAPEMLETLKNAEVEIAVIKESLPD